MRLKIALFAAAAVLAAGTAQAAPSVELRDAVARVTVIPEARPDVRVEIVAPNAQLPLSVRTEGERTVIDGRLDRRIRSTRGSGRDARVRVEGVGDVSWEEMPQVVIRTPMAVAVASDGVVFGSVGRSASLELRNSGYGVWTLADVAGEAGIHESGAGSVRMGAADRLRLRLSGASNVHAVRVRQGLDAVLSGAGGLSLDELQGDMDAKVSGVGKVRIEGGRARVMRASVSGLGGVQFDGVADSLDAAISGIGSIRVREVTGPVRKSVSGLGKVTVERPS